MKIHKKALVIAASILIIGALAIPLFSQAPIFQSIIHSIDLYQPQPLPTSSNIPISFTSQAPQGNWQEPWQNACEEAAIVMVENFYKEEKLDPAKARQEILEVFKLKKETAPASKDESLERIEEIINSGKLNWQVSIVNNPTLEAMKAELAAHRPIIAPTYAPTLANPNYDSYGSMYHVIVITGYDDQSKEFITQDPGTKDGKNYRYSYDVLMKSLHDYLENKDYASGAKRVLFTKYTGS